MVSWALIGHTVNTIMWSPMQWFHECGRCRMRIEPRSGFLMRPISLAQPCLPSMVIDTVPLSSGMRTMRLRRPKLAWA
ncbi:hypothetical protein D3C72_1428610 [compost metagenome]